MILPYLDSEAAVFHTAFESAFALLYQPVLNSTVAVNIVRCNTGLSAVQIFSEYDSSCCQFDIGSLIYNTRALSAQL